tara:strand:+ start:822 stop:1517 length:696 start_codon:yes stop_codon:yes gene_type:complete
MKKHLIYIILSLSVLIQIHCSNESGPKDPLAPILISPNNNEACLDGSIVNDSQSSVDFQWSVSENAVSYEVVVNNLANQTSQIYGSGTNQLNITLTNAEPYSWFVNALGEDGTTPASSQTWKFYLAGKNVINYAPFPPELLSPRSGGNLTPVNGIVLLSWNCTDVDNDLESFEVYLDNSNGTTLLKTIPYETLTTEIEVEVESKKDYYWKIIAIDTNGNSSSSGVYGFRTN